MAVLCLSKDLDDLKERLSRMVVAYNMDDEPVTVKDLKVQGALTMVLKDAIKPNLVQTLEKTPALIHGGPFANIAHGANSIIATDFASRVSEYVVTEAGFGADLGMEKFMDIKMRTMDTMPSAVVLVASIRALKLHGDADDKNLDEENVEALQKGIVNLEKHIESIKHYQRPYVIAINRFPKDTENEIKALLEWAKKNDHPISLSEVFAKGSKGGQDLANKVIELTKNAQVETNQPLYPLDMTIKDKIETIAKKIYGADGVDFKEKALEQMKTFEKNGWDKLSICMAKTPLSLSDDSKLKGRPKNFRITVRSLKPSVGAGFVVALTGKVMTMPGLPRHGAYENMDVIDNKIIGLF
jgi:formate--tetrahydrofolate ligase